MSRSLFLAASLLVPAVASAAGGGGITADLQYMPRYGAPSDPHDAPGAIGCLGGMGYGATRSGFRIGGEGSFCRGRDEGVSMAYGGLQLGHWRGSKFFYWSGYATIGAGTFGDGSEGGSDPYRSIFLLAKPTLAMGFALGPTALEVGLYGMIPVNVVQWVGTNESRGVITPSVGVQMSLLFGNFRADKRRPERPVQGCGQPSCAPPPPPCTSPGCAPACPQPGGCGPQQPLSPQGQPPQWPQNGQGGVDRPYQPMPSGYPAQPTYMPQPGYPSNLPEGDVLQPASTSERMIIVDPEQVLQPGEPAYAPAEAPADVPEDQLALPADWENRL